MSFIVNINRERNGLKDSIFTFTNSFLKEAHKYLLEICYFKFWNKIFTQVVGIPVVPNLWPTFFYIIMRTDGLEKLHRFMTC